jgi:hypothetical protein
MTAPSAEQRHAAIMGAIFGSDDFIRRTRNPDLPSPSKGERTEKRPGDIELLGDGSWYKYGERSA